MTAQTTIKDRWEVIRNALNEDQRRLWLGTEAMALGSGGISAVAAATSTSRTTVRAGLALAKALIDGEEDPQEFKPEARVRKPGAGRPPILKSQKGLLEGLFDLFEHPHDSAKPPAPMLWTTKGRAKLAEQLCQEGFQIGQATLGELLKEHGFRIRASTEFAHERKAPPFMDQFQTVSERVSSALANQIPVVGMDLFKVRRAPTISDVEPDFTFSLQRHNRQARLDLDATDTRGDPHCRVCGSTRFRPGNLSDVDSVTVDLAVQTLMNWWRGVGSLLQPARDQLLVIVGNLSDHEPLMQNLASGLASAAANSSLVMEVMHLPPGTSKWRTVTQKYSASTNLYTPGRSLERHEVIIELVGDELNRSNRSARRHGKLHNRYFNPTREELCSRSVLIEPIGAYADWNFAIKVKK